MKNIAIIFVLFIAGIQVIHPDLQRFALYPDCYWANHITYMMIHASWLHLLCNAWYFLDFSFRAKSLTPSMWIMAICIALVMPSFTVIPVVGLSGLLYALSGFLWVYSTDKWHFGMVFIAMTILQIFVGTTAVLFHLSCFGAAIAAALLLLPVYNRSSK